MRELMKLPIRVVLGNGSERVYEADQVHFDDDGTVVLWDAANSAQPVAEYPKKTVASAEFGPVHGEPKVISVLVHLTEDDRGFAVLRFDAERIRFDDNGNRITLENPDLADDPLMAPGWQWDRIAGIEFLGLPPDASAG